MKHTDIKNGKTPYVLFNFNLFVIFNFQLLSVHYYN